MRISDSSSDVCSSDLLAFAEEFGVALGAADDVVVMEVYAAGEEPVPGATGATVAAAVPLPAEHVVFEPSWTAVPGHLAERARPELGRASCRERVCPYV